MRWVVLILGLVGAAGLFVQSASLFTLARMTEEDQGTMFVGAVGVVMAGLWLVASAAAIAGPQVSAVLLAVAGVMGHLFVSDDFPDLRYWGTFSFLLTIAAAVGWVLKRRHDERAAALAERRHQELLAAARSGWPPPP